MKKGRSWFAIEAKAGGKEADVFIYDTVGIWGVSANDFVRELSDITAETINLRINSPGGNVFDGVAIFNSLKKHPARVKTHVEALAASIASIIALAGDEVEISENAFFMIHNPYTIAIGDAENMRKTAGMLDKVTDSLVKTYTDKTGKTDAEIRDLMDDETWFTAEEAKEAGFADTITDEAPVEAAFDLTVFNNVPTHVFNTLNAAKPSPRKLEHALREVGGLSKTDAKAVVAKGYKALDHREDGEDESHREDDSTQTQKTEREERGMKKNELIAQHPDLYNSIVAEAKEGLLSQEEVDKRVQAGVDAENARILALDKLSADMPGHEDLIAGFKINRAISAESAALQIVAAHGEKLKGIAAQQAADAAALAKVPGSDGGEGGGEEAKGFMALVADYMAEHKCKKTEAIKAVAASHEKEHSAFISKKNEGGK